MNYKKEVLKDSEINHALAKANLKKTVVKTKKLPHSFIPASKDFFKEQFYWDSFFIIQGLVTEDAEDKKVAKNMVDNFLFMINKYGYIPNSYDTYDTRSQPPFLSSLVLQIYNLDKNKKWLRKAFSKLKKEYSYWTKYPKKVLIGLSRFYDDKDHLDKAWDKSYGSIQECGWDNTLRFGGNISKCGKYVENSVADKVCAIDLNVLLYKMEKDIEKICKILRKNFEVWEERAKKRKKLINKYCWNSKKGFFYDYNFENKRQLDAETLAGFFPLWTGFATKKQADLLRKKLKKFEHEWGLVTTQESLGCKNIQWGYPNGWAPLHWIVIMGLRKYGFDKDADRLTYKWLKICARECLSRGEWEEKICVVAHHRRKDDARYKNQSVTNWTEGVFLSLYDSMK